MSDLCVRCQAMLMDGENPCQDCGAYQPSDDEDGDYPLPGRAELHAK